MRAKILTLFAALALVLILIINIFPLRFSQNMIVETTREQMLSSANFVASSLAPLPVLTAEKIALTLEMLEFDRDTRILVCDASALVLYDSAQNNSLQGRFFLTPEIGQAFSKKDVFHCRYSDAAFFSRLAVPIQYNSGPIGVVYLTKTDRTQGAILQSLRTQMCTISIVICIILFLLVMLFSSRLSARFRTLLTSIRSMKSGAFGDTVSVSGHDELSEIAEEFNQLSKRLEDTEALRQTFVSDASHELRTPLSAIRLLTDSILQSDEIDIETTREFLVDIGDEIDRLTRIAEKLLVLTRLDGAQSLTLAPVNLSEVAMQVLEALEPIAQEDHILLKADLTDALYISADKDGVYQIIFNLVENAIKYNRPGGFVHVMLFSKEDACILLVDDNGIGIPEEHRAHIFERFYRVDKARARSGKGGTGLGLSIVFKNVETYHGTIEVGASASGGTRFTVTFPKFEEGGADFA
ncbi:MAG: HAMP domain-containing histidine kinase [Oscillospiraceae bacterium]|nr:HAMP domain-containing histidine kinase [Oscillospiraceae bacterium]